MVLPAPARFSTTIGWPSCGDRCSNTTRGTMSVVLPAPNGTITRRGFDGQLCAAAGSARAASARSRKRFIVGFLLWLKDAEIFAAGPTHRPIYNFSDY